MDAPFWRLQDALTFCAIGFGLIVSGILYVKYSREALVAHIKAIGGAQVDGIPVIPMWGGYYFEARWVGGGLLAICGTVFLAALAWPVILKLDLASLTVLALRLLPFLVSIAVVQIISYKTGAKHPDPPELLFRLLLAAVLVDLAICLIWLGAYAWLKGGLVVLTVGLLSAIFLRKAELLGDSVPK